ncbi:PPR domain-containing protein/PPR_2 domain-containing protein [Cephalotus follicularis]|uniref:PPR domain-containing protein/PPR_2 domain-containing protein n=1 Tax=Cephalotus follicularis TaxID=3775 RepID=A0A1Q3C1C0_CEPFO|nr:PPR domain-containing protein/PPR_2 domain-containing protein [Cephalotus follicularis]
MLWNLIIKTHVEFGLFNEALLLYKKMRQLGVLHDRFTFPTVNRAVLLLKTDVVSGELIHCVAVKFGFGLDLYFGNTMIEVYSKSGFVEYAYKVFGEMLNRDLVSWTSMVSGYVYEGSICSAFALFNKMRLELKPNSVSVVVLLNGCSNYGSVLQGRLIHCYTIRSGLFIDFFVQNSILRMYTKMGSVEEVEDFFNEIYKRDVVSWNTLISFYSIRGDIAELVDRFNETQGEVVLSIETLTLVISAFAKSGNLFLGEKAHCFAIKSGQCDDILQTSLLDFYAKCGVLGRSVRLFGEISHRSSITWSAMMSGFILNGCFNEAIGLFHEMQDAGLKPGPEILRSLIDAYTHLGALQLGKVIHGYVLRNLLHGPEEGDSLLETSVLNMYIRCGSISTARVCFDRMPVKDVVAWTSMIEGYGIHGLGIEAVKLFNHMQENGITPNSVTFLSLLSACSHSGLVTEGCEVFNFMKWRFGIEPDLDHHTCMVDLLGRSGNLKEALKILVKMMTSPDSRIWGALLSASRVHGDKKLGEFAAKRLLELEPDSVGYYTLLCNIQASRGQWAEVEEVRRIMNENELKKKPGWSCIEMKGGIHGFVSADRSHNQVDKIYDLLGHLSRKIQIFGYV